VVTVVSGVDNPCHGDPEHCLLSDRRNYVRNNPQQIFILCTFVPPPPLSHRTTGGLIYTTALRTARFNFQKFYVLPTQCIYVFCVDLRTNTDYFTVQH
jgi:hypothetical protein